MSEDLTQKLPQSDRDAILAAIHNLETRVGSIDSRLQGVEQKLGHLEQTVEERLHDTRPIWHRVVADIGELKAGQQRLEKGQEAMRADLSELNTAVRNVNRDQIVINDVIRKIQLDFHIIDERLHRLIVNSNPQNSST
jgi:seryl-tRNA synthetase